MGVGAVIMAVCVGLTAPVAAAENDPYGSFTSDNGTVWVTMSVSEYLDQPVVQQMQKQMESLAAFSFRAGDDVVTDDEPRPGWSVVRQGAVTRYLTRKGRTRTIEYVGPRKTCRRTAPPGTAFSIASDTSATWRCRVRTDKALDGSAYASSFFPLDAIRDVDPETMRVLVPQESLAGVSDVGDADLRVMIKPVGVLAGVGLVGGPGTFYDYSVGSRSLGTRIDQFNGLAWNIGEFKLSRRGVPRLPAAVTGLVR